MEALPLGSWMRGMGAILDQKALQRKERVVQLVDEFLGLSQWHAMQVNRSKC